ncbi:flagellar filament capping protein FliD [Domibacillus indicus]|uniref:flagellar filament capping protein FliD n=1 Tax=Domibacillus indicus TaxID=1437523 RepID=UPI0020403A70|nr:flagellar filament capping protein FliD [Domibacillus indicus]MCM3787399.1 flagellar filament capping protein FliD [Domibacillus indicus]
MVLRVGGMASGMDTESIIKDLMKAERIPLDKLKQKKQTLEWQRDQYREMNLLLNDFKNLTSSTGMKKTQNYRASAVTTSNESLVTATSSTAASQGSYNISSVTKLASAETWVTAKLNETAGETLDATKALSDAANNSFAKDFAWTSGKVESKTLSGVTGGNTVSLGVAAGSVQSADAVKMSVKVNGVDYNVIAPGDSFDASKNQAKIDADGNITFSNSIAAGSTVKVDYISVAQNGEQYADFSITAQTSKGEVEENFLISSTDTLNQVVSKVNGSNAGVSMFFDMATNKISLMQKETGDFTKDNNGDYTLNTASNLSISGVFATDILKLDNTAAVSKGSDAEFVINGLATTRKSNTFDMNGVSITLKGTFDSTQAISLSVSKDTDTVYNNIKDFVDKYNTLIAAISKKTSEERYRDYTPLTDEQREQLSDKQQEQWEEKAKSGLLRRDTTLTGVLSTMRSNFSQAVTNSSTNASYNQLAEIGITTSSNYLEGGKLEIDETKLKKALAENPEAVEALFIGGSGSTSVSEQGIIHRLYNTVDKAMDQLKDRAGSAGYTNQKFAIGRQLTSVDNSITRFEDRLTQVEDRYWKQFTAMEKAMQNANSQSAYLMQQFSS